MRVRGRSASSGSRTSERDGQAPTAPRAILGPMSRPQPGFAAVDPPEGGWRPTRGRFHPARLEAPVESLSGVGPTLRKRLAKLGLERVGDLLDHRPRRYEEPVPEKRIAELWGDDEVVIAGEVLKTSSRRGRGRLRSEEH